MNRKVVSLLIKSILFDLGGVVLDVDFNRVFKSLSSFSGINELLIKSKFSFDKAYEQFERGEIDSIKYYESLRESLGIEVPDAEFEDAWNNIFDAEISGIKEVLDKVNRDIDLYAFSNTNEIHYQFLSKKFEATLKHFKEVFLSYKLKCRKPEIEAYKKVAQLMGHSFKEILFFDDLKENIDAAEHLGMRTKLVSSISDVRDAIDYYQLNN